MAYISDLIFDILNNSKKFMLLFLNDFIEFFDVDQNFLTKH